MSAIKNKTLILSWPKKDIWNIRYQTSHKKVYNCSKTNKDKYKIRMNSLSTKV